MFWGSKYLKYWLKLLRDINKGMSSKPVTPSPTVAVSPTVQAVSPTAPSATPLAPSPSASISPPDTSQPNSIPLHCAKQIDDLLNESMSMEVNGKVFSSQDHANSTYVRNPDLWCEDLDLTCLSPWNNSGGHKKAGTLVTPRHVIGAAHYEYSVGAVVRFVEKNGTVHDRTVKGKARHPNYKPHYPDLTIYTLDSDLPSSITPCSVMPSDYSKYFDNIYKSKIPCIGFDQEEKALIIDWANGGRMRTPTDSKRRIFHESKIKGDSGNPAFLVFNGELVLMTVWTYGGAGGGTPIAKHISDINDMIATADNQAGVSTNYTVTEADFSPDLTEHWPTFKYLEGEIVGNLTKTRTLGLDDSGVIHSLGYKSDYHITTDTVHDNITREEVGYKGFIGNVHASDGYTYYLPAYSSSLAKLERKTGKLTLEEKFSGIPQVRSGAEGANGIIYMPSYTKTLKIYTYNTNTGETGVITPPQPGFYGHVWGAAADKDGNIYMPPALSNKILKIDTNGEVSILSGDPVTSGVSGFDVKYVGATYVESVNKVFCLPRTGKTVLIIDCVDDTYKEVDLPADYLAVANKNKNFNGYLAPDGWLYSAFWADTKCFRINPNTYEIQWRDYSEEFMDGKATIEEGSGIMSIGTGFTTAAITVGNNVYFGLAGTSKAVKLDFAKQIVNLKEDVAPTPSATIQSSYSSSSPSATIQSSYSSSSSPSPTPTPSITICGSCPSPTPSASICGSYSCSCSTYCGSCPSSSATICGSCSTYCCNYSSCCSTCCNYCNNCCNTYCSCSTCYCNCCC
tara:strand:- start:940 stop:3318 length:2379 start_codon:yes stop_codon:yes gene_type:complete